MVLRIVAVTCGPVPVRTAERFSSNGTSRTQCSRFSIAKDPDPGRMTTLEGVEYSLRIDGLAGYTINFMR